MQTLGKEARFAECQFVALGKESVVGAHWNFLCRVPDQQTLDKGHHGDFFAEHLVSLGKDFAECPT
jgi:hypothetical protein